MQETTSRNESLGALVAGAMQTIACLLQDPVDANADLRP